MSYSQRGTKNHLDLDYTRPRNLTELIICFIALIIAPKRCLNRPRVKLIPDCLLEIFSYLKNDRRTLFSCIRVSRLWCRLAIPILWSAPFKYYSQSYTSKIINTYISCLDIQDKEFLKSIGLRIPVRRVRPLFCYPKYLEGFSIDNYTIAMKRWVNDNFHCVHDKWDLLRTQQIVDSMIMDLTFNDSSSLKKFKYVNYDGFSRINFLEKLSNSDLSLINTFEFLGHGYTKEMCFITLPKLFKQMSKSSRNIKHLAFYFPKTSKFYYQNFNPYNPTELDLSVAELIRSQNSLKSFCTNEFWLQCSTELIFSSLISHSNSLKFIKFFTLINLNQSFFQYIKQIHSLRTLEVKRFLSFEQSLSQNLIPQNYLSQIQNIYFDERGISYQLIDTIIRLTNLSLKKFYSRQTNLSILLSIESFCPNLTHLHISLDKYFDRLLNIIKKLPLISFYLQVRHYSKSLKFSLPSTLQCFGLDSEINQDDFEDLLDNAYLPNLSTMELLYISGINENFRKIFIKFNEKFNYQLKELKLEKNLLKKFILLDKKELWNTRTFKINEVKNFKYTAYEEIFGCPFYKYT
ncbi:hypothetical protein C1645_870088 [Glomus cerebriforme]|uniref:F-box domain-containing protein n=1 Tax=Glomus cerebriforme TaxID=658196 RepID=A0A397TLR0_9GLOM|nr:hypothetical protein C1645_870088 [Glomus cerebriforme]